MLTFDLEEFDIPEEYGQKVPDHDQMQVTLAGMERVMAVLEKHQVRATFFTTGHFARKNPELVRHLAQKHEIASHALYHSPGHEFRITDILESKKILEEVSGQTITGFRMPRLQAFDIHALRPWGFLYDSSINPTWLPGRYNLLHRNPLPGIEEGLIELPCSTTPYVRFPLFWLSFKNLPAALYNALCRFTLRKRKNLMLYFHPWEFADIGGYKLPGFVKNPDGARLATKLDRLIQSLARQNVAFVTSKTFCERFTSEKAVD